jgi:hypothetical protein
MRARKGARWGAIAGGTLGLAMGAATGDKRMAAAGAAVGAAAGAGAGAMCEYDQGKQDDRTQIVADAIAAPKSEGSATAGTAASPQETVGDIGRRKMRDFLGDWKLDIWVLGADGQRITASGTSQGLDAGENATRLIYREITAEGIEGSYGGYSLLTYDPGQGFFLENSFSTTGEVVEFVGEYLPDKNAFNYYMTTGSGEEMVSGGIIRSAVRVEIRTSGPAIFVAETYTLIDGEEVQVQQYRFTRGCSTTGH